MVRTSLLTAVGAACCGLLLLACGAGCVSVAPRPDVAGMASRATLAGDAIVFDTKGGPLDVVGDTPDLLTLPQAVRLALGSEPDVQAALSRVRVAEAEADQVRLLPNPILSVALRFPQNIGTPVDIGLTEDLVSLLQRPGRVDAADNRLRGAAADALGTVLDTLAGVQEHYAAVQSLDALMPVLEERRSLIDRLLKLAQERLDVKEGTQLDVTTLETQRLELEVEVSEKRLERRQERLTLARLIGRPSLPAEWRVTPWEPLAVPAADEARWVATALDHRPEVEAGRWELAALGVDVRLARLSPFEGADVGIAVEKERDWTAGPTATVPIPLFDWGQAKLAKAQGLRLEARHKLTKIRRQIVEDVRRQYAEFTSTTSTLEIVRDRLLPAQARRQSQTEAAYRAGSLDITALILAEQDYQTARTKLIELQHKAASGLIRLQRAVGGPGASACLEGALPPTTRTATPPATGAAPP